MAASTSLHQPCCQGRPSHGTWGWAGHMGEWGWVYQAMGPGTDMRAFSKRLGLGSCGPCVCRSAALHP